ncbi:hypothetical protein WJX73_001703 [Symbiochloris irregularis]|uniref:Uncharacterized protein n=1 Tax=Symbiochloris irregularis TaxID=706552 RepID=A0AAW1PMU7_9CHLO
MAVLHKYRAVSAESVSSAERRETEATSSLSGILTGSCLMTMFVVRKLGLALAQVDELTSGTRGMFSEPSTPAEAKKLP